MRLIDADALKGAFVRYVRTPPHMHYGDWDKMCISGTEIDEVVDNAPTIDAELVVRCKGCEYARRVNWYSDDDILCSIFDHIVRPEEFCCNGMPKEDDDDAAD